MTSYAVGHLRNVEMGPDIVAYLETIDATLAPFHGRFIIHGGEKEELEGAFPGDLIVIAFPDRQAARAWYASPAYQAILPKRTGNSQGNVFLIDGVDEDHCAADILSVKARHARRRPGMGAPVQPLYGSIGADCRRSGFGWDPR